MSHIVSILHFLHFKNVVVYGNDTQVNPRMCLCDIISSHHQGSDIWGCVRRLHIDNIKKTRVTDRQLFKVPRDISPDTATMIIL